MIDKECPILGGYRLKIRPELRLKFEEIVEEKKLLSGRPRWYHKGYLLRARLRFGRNQVITKEERERLLQLFQSREVLEFLPLPDSQPEKRYQVRWVDEFNFAPIFGSGGELWSGSISLEGAEVLSSI